MRGHCSRTAPFQNPDSDRETPGPSANLVSARDGHFDGLQNRGATRLELDEFPTVKLVKCYLIHSTG